MQEIINVKCDNLYGDGRQITIEMVALTSEAIDKAVPAGIMPGNYVIGRLTGNTLNVIYVGRVDYRQDEGLKDRLKEHIGEWYGNLYFYWNKANSVKDSFETECNLYHFWLEHEGQLENSIHPRKPANQNYTCPVCGQ